MEKLRTLSTRTRRHGGDASTTSLIGEKLERSASVPSYAPSIKPGGGGGGMPEISEELPRQKSKKVAATGKFSHPIFSLFDGGRRNKKKVTAKPEFSRYVEYLKEGGMWDSSSNTPTIFFK